jgi:hypothetical protein
MSPKFHFTPAREADLITGNFLELDYLFINENRTVVNQFETV